MTFSLFATSIYWDLSSKIIFTVLYGEGVLWDQKYFWKASFLCSKCVVHLCLILSSVPLFLILILRGKVAFIWYILSTVYGREPSSLFSSTTMSGISSELFILFSHIIQIVCNFFSFFYLKCIKTFAHSSPNQKAFGTLSSTWIEKVPLFLNQEGVI